MLNNTGASAPLYCDTWVKDLGSAPQPKDWRKMWEALFKSSCNVLALKNSFKVMSHWYFTQLGSQNVYRPHPTALEVVQIWVT